MKKQFLLLLLLLSTGAAFSQSMLGHSRSVVRTNLKRYIRQHNFTNTKIEEQADTMTMKVNEEVVKKVTFRYIFNDKRWCREELKTTDCEECQSTLLKEILENKKFEWTKINDSTYVSKFSKKRLLTTSHTGNTWLIDIRKIKWSHQEYENRLAAR